MEPSPGGSHAESNVALGHDLSVKFNSTSTLHLRDTYTEPDLDELTWWCALIIFCCSSFPLTISKRIRGYIEND